VPVPGSLTSLFGGGSGAAVGTGLAIKAAAAVTAGLAIGGASYEGVRHVPWPAQKPTAVAQQKAAVAVRAPVHAAVSSRQTSRITPAKVSGTHGNAAKAAKDKATKGKNVNANSHANNSRSHRNASIASHSRGAAHSNRAHPVGGPRAHPKAKVKPKRLQLPGSVGDHPAPAPGHGKQK
jgi:hypothetical protein